MQHTNVDLAPLREQCLDPIRVNEALAMPSNQSFQENIKRLWFWEHQSSQPEPCTRFQSTSYLLICALNFSRRLAMKQENIDPSFVGARQMGAFNNSSLRAEVPPLLGLVLSAVRQTSTTFYKNEGKVCSPDINDEHPRQSRRWKRWALTLLTCTAKSETRSI